MSGHLSAPTTTLHLQAQATTKSVGPRTDPDSAKHKQSNNDVTLQYSVQMVKISMLNCWGIIIQNIYVDQQKHIPKEATQNVIHMSTTALSFFFPSFIRYTQSLTKA